MNDLEQRLERIEDAILELATTIEEGEYENLYNRIGDILFDHGENSEDTED